MAAEDLAREAVHLGEGADAPVNLGEAFLDLGSVLRERGRSREAASAFEAALAQFERRDAVVLEGWARAALAAVGP